MRAARELGCPRIRVSPPRYDRPSVFAAIRRGVGQLHDVERLAGYGVRGASRSHGNICSSPAHRLVSHFDRYRRDPRSRNMVYEGMRVGAWGWALGPIWPTCTSRTARQCVGAKPTGEANWLGLGAAIDQESSTCASSSPISAVGYDGWCSFEDFSDSGSTRDKLTHNLAYVKAHRLRVAGCGRKPRLLHDGSPGYRLQVAGYRREGHSLKPVAATQPVTTPPARNPQPVTRALTPTSPPARRRRQRHERRDGPTCRLPFLRCR